jgi:transcriptional regulator with XRE-family HTH domain
MGMDVRADMDALGRFVANKRAELDWNLRKTAERCGISKSYLASIEKGDAKNLSVEKLHSIARGLGVPFEVLDGLATGRPADSAARMAIERESDDLYQLIQRLPEDRRPLARRLLNQLLEP